MYVVQSQKNPFLPNEILNRFHSLFRYGRVQSVKLLASSGGSSNGKSGKFNNGTSDGGSSSSSSSSSVESGAESATVAFMDITSACKAHAAEHTMDDRVLRTDFYDPSSVTVGGGVSDGPAGQASSGASGASSAGPAGSGKSASGPAGASSQSGSAAASSAAIQGRLHG